MAIGSHHSTHPTTNDWLTPPEIIQALGPFDLDPCASRTRPWDTAKVHYTVDDDGLSKPWFGRVWLNPPYSSHATRWLLKLAEHGNGIAFTFARTETRWFFGTVWDEPAATAILFLRGRIHFYYPDGRMAEANAGAPSVLIAYGEENAAILRDSGIEGKFIHLK